MRNRILIIALIFIALVGSLSFGCVSYTVEEGYSIMQTALNNSLSGVNHDINYTKLTKIAYNSLNEKETFITKVNVLATEKDYEIIKTDGSYDNLHAMAIESYSKGNTSAKETKSTYYGNLNGGKSIVVIENGSLTAIRTMTDAELYACEEFNGYTLDSFLKEIKSLKVNEMNFDGDNFGVEKKGNVVTLRFALAIEYLNSYKSAFGVDSPLDAEYVVVEVAYDRIQSVTAYKLEPGFENMPDSLKIEYESYKLEISYRGPKFSADINEYLPK